MTIGDRIRSRRAAQNLTMKQLGDYLGVSRGAVNEWESGRSRPDVKRLEAIAKKLKTSVQYLLSGNGDLSDSDNTSGEEIRGWIPLISYVQAGSWHEAVDLFEPGCAEQIVPTTVPHSLRTFALRVEGSSMTLPSGVEGRSFPPGMIIYVDPEREPQTGDYVVARYNGDSQVTFKRLMTEEGRAVLMPLNPDRSSHPVIRDEFEIIGRVIDASWGGL